MDKLMQTRTRNGQVFPSPRAGETIYEDPPAFVWLKEDVTGPYHVTLKRKGEVIWQGETQNNFMVPERAFGAGEYTWDVCADGKERGEVGFTIAPNAVTFIRPSANDIFDAVPDERPRMLFTSTEIPDILNSRKDALDTLNRNVALALTRPLPAPPMFHRDENALPYREYFGLHRDDCDRDLVACALKYTLTGDEAAGAHAKALFLTLCDWNSEGPCSLEGPWGDEVGLSHARCFPAVYDLLWNLMSPNERLFTGRVVALYAMQCERRLKKLDFCQNPGNSHAGRLPAYLGEAAMSLKGTGVMPDDTLKRWLEYAVSIYGGVFPYFGGPDGGWAEGTFYSTSYTKWYLPFFCAVERFAGCSFLMRPFFQRYIRYLQHFCPPGWEVHPFGDGYWCKPDDAEWPGFFAQNPYHIYAERFGTALERKWSRDAQRQSIFKLHLLDVFLPEGKPVKGSLADDVTRAHAFPDTGYVSLHTDPYHPASELALVARASRYGAISHEHSDQGNFALMAGGTALICPSGYFGRQCGSMHHIGWTRRTKAHNTILIDGVGQIGEDHISNAADDQRYAATGQVLYARDEGDHLTAAVDASNAYARAERFVRRFTLTSDELVVEDEITLSRPMSITWLLHSLSQPTIVGSGFAIERNGWQLAVTPQQGGLCDPRVWDHYDVDLNAGEPAQYHVTMPQQYHMSLQTGIAKEHHIAVRFKVTRSSANE